MGARPLGIWPTRPINRMTWVAEGHAFKEQAESERLEKPPENRTLGFELRPEYA